MTIASYHSAIEVLIEFDKNFDHRVVLRDHCRRSFGTVTWVRFPPTGKKTAIREREIQEKRETKGDRHTHCKSMTLSVFVCVCERHGQCVGVCVCACLKFRVKTKERGFVCVCM